MRDEDSETFPLLRVEGYKLLLASFQGTYHEPDGSNDAECDSAPEICWKIPKMCRIVQENESLESAELQEQLTDSIQ